MWLWLYGQIKAVLETFVMEKQAEEHRILLQSVNICNEPRKKPQFQCSVCGNLYFYKKCRDKHEEKHQNEESTEGQNQNPE